jgi:Phage integrase family
VSDRQQDRPHFHGPARKAALDRSTVDQGNGAAPSGVHHPGHRHAGIDDHQRRDRTGQPVTAELLFTTKAGGPLKRPDFNQVCWRPARRAAGVPDTRENGIHVLRHTAASAWPVAGVDIRTVAEYLGHADPGFTLRTYSRLMPDAAAGPRPQGDEHLLRRHFGAKCPRCALSRGQITVYAGHRDLRRIHSGLADVRVRASS